MYKHNFAKKLLTNIFSSDILKSELALDANEC